MTTFFFSQLEKTRRPRPKPQVTARPLTLLFSCLNLLLTKFAQKRPKLHGMNLLITFCLCFESQYCMTKIIVPWTIKTHHKTQLFHQKLIPYHSIFSKIKQIFSKWFFFLFYGKIINSWDTDFTSHMSTLFALYFDFEFSSSYFILHKKSIIFTDC